MADPHAADASGQVPAPMSRRERREAERRAAREASRVASVTAEAAMTSRAATEGAEAPAGEQPADRPAVATGPGPGLEDSLGPAVGLEGHEAPGPVADGEIGDTSAPLPSGGRNVPVAIGVGVGLGLLVVASLFLWRKEAFLGLAVIGCAFGLYELSRAVAVRDIKLPLLPLLVGTVGITVSAYTAGVEALLVASVLTSGGAFIWRVLDGGGVAALRDATAAVFATAYVPFMAGFIALMLAADDGPWRVLTYICICVASDTGGYIAGVLFGRTRLAPIVSPKKSWEGLVGSYVLASGVGVGLMVGVLQGPWWAGLALGVAGVTAATLGDLAESLIKRDLGVKDMGNILPGHGGVLDRVDSLLFAAPVAFLIFHAVLGS